MTSRRPPIDFPSIASAALGSARRLLVEWIPGGDWNGDEYKPRNPTRDDKHPGSFVINARTGKWIDNATSDAGGDLISLYAYIHFTDQISAAKAVAAMVGVDITEDGANPRTLPPKGSHPSTLDTDSSDDVAKHRKTPWVPIMPVPDDAPVPPVAHYVRGRPDVIYTYRAADGLVNGYVYRFTTSDGGKETLPVCFCKNRDDGKRDWRWIGFGDNRPLYRLDKLVSADIPVVLVEGEKCVDSGDVLLGGVFQLITWQGGTKAVGKSDLSPLAAAGLKIYAWADCDAQRRKLTGHEKQSGVDPDAVPLLPESDQPGMRAMREIHKILLELNPNVDFQFVDIPKPGDKPGGWDIADAIAEGMDAEALSKFVRNVRKPSSKKSPGAINRSESGLLLDRDYKIRACLANIHDVLQNDSRWSGVLAFNEFSYSINKLKPPPYHRSTVGEWEINDDVQTAMWLTREYGFAPTPQQVAEAIEALARASGYHPVRDYLNSIEWDGEKRLDDWLFDYLGVPKSPYTMRVARWFLMGMVARVMHPGIKFDYCLVLEGIQGRRKSSMFRVLAGEWFGNTDLDLHNKDSMAAIMGKWLYEIAELDALARAESTRQKSFLSREIDEFRPAYGHRNIRNPRQLVFGGTTNSWAWNKDETGGRRFWPIECRYEIDIDGLSAVRDQLFAEAYVRYKNGDRFWPTSDEQRLIFDSEQIKRHLQDGYVDYLADFVKQQVTEFSMADAADHLKIDAARLSRDLQTRIGKALALLGCTKKEKRTNEIRTWYQPPGTPCGTGDMNDVGEGGADGIPF